MKPLDAHLELLRRLPVRKVESRREPAPWWMVHSDRKPGLRDPQEQARLCRRVQRMRAAGVERCDIAEALNLSTSTVDRYIAGTLSRSAKRIFSTARNGARR